MINGEYLRPQEVVIESHDFLFMAVLDTVFEIGGHTLVNEVREALRDDIEFPSTSALQFLEMKRPGISDQIFKRAAEIQELMEMEPHNIQQAG